MFKGTIDDGMRGGIPIEDWRGVVTLWGDDAERVVELGPTVGSDWLVLKGLKAGEKVVYEGLQRVSDGAAVDARIVSPETVPNEKEKT